ncbi:ycf20-like protein [Rutidosis leptorrhynchoides]|uniref:ycf20-like protein n=1 Tax=Rutidosis leptorrhynchoides TaxID=125765 RepID=UPI003A98DA15
MVPASLMPPPGYLDNLCTFASVRSKVSSAGFSSKSTFSIRKTLYARFWIFHLTQPFLVSESKRMTWHISSSTDGNGFDPSSENNGINGTRLIRAIRAFQIKLNARIKELRKDLPMKLLFFLTGFYCSTAFATVIGQTGDWDILSAALAVFVVEGIGALMYTGSFPLLNKARNLITMFNYWKAGLCMGLFLDSFKY